MLRSLLDAGRKAGLRAIAPCLAGLSVLVAVAGCDTGRRVLSPLPKPTAAPIEEPSSAPTAPQAGLLPATAAGSVPLSLDEVNRIAGKGLFKSGDPPLPGPSDSKGSVKPPECQPVLHALNNKAVSGTAHNGYQFVVFPATDDPYGVFEEAVVVYPELDSAKAVFQKVSSAVGSCGGKTVGETAPGSDQAAEFDITTEANEDGKLRWTEEDKSQSSGDCVFEVRMIKNLLFEVVECGSGAGDVATKVADAMAAKAV